MCLRGNTKKEANRITCKSRPTEVEYTTEEMCVFRAFRGEEGQGECYGWEHHAPLSFIPSPLFTQGKVLPLLIGSDFFDVTYPLRQSS